MKCQLEVKTSEVKPLDNSVFKKIYMEDLEKIRSKIKLSILLPNMKQDKKTELGILLAVMHFHI